MFQPRYNVAQWWHILSLDAPTVAALWSWFFAHAMGQQAPPASFALLAFGTWLLYVADRILDGLRRQNSAPLRERHLFHARHRRMFLIAALSLSILFVWTILTRTRPRAFRDDTWIAAWALLYLIAVHFRPRSSARKPASWLPKELVVGVLFAAATAVPAWSRLHSGRVTGVGPGKSQLAPAVACFALLCWINCVAIETWECDRDTPSASGHPHPITRWAGAHLRRMTAILALLSLAAAELAPSRGLTAVYLATLMSSGLLLLLDMRRSRISALDLRIAADAALLTPLALLPLIR